MPGDLAAALVAAGMDAVDVRDVGLTAHEDDDVMTRAIAEGRAIVTADVGFASIVRYPPGSHGGVVLVRMHDVPAPRQIALVVARLTALRSDEVAGNLVVIDERRARVRRLP